MSTPRPVVLLVGAGGLGCPVALALAREGVTLRLVDDDVVDESNLQRQLLYGPADVGRVKVEVAAERLSSLGARVEPVRARLTRDTAPQLLAGAALAIDGSDNFDTRFLANDACVAAGLPLVHAAVLRFTGQLLTVKPGVTACYRCLFEGPPPPGAVPSCAEAGVLGALCGLLAAAAADEALALLRGEAEGGVLTVIEAAEGRVRTVRVPRDPRCVTCGEKARYTDLSSLAKGWTA